MNPKILDRAIYYYTRSAELGDKDAMFVMGTLHEEGSHVPQSKFMAKNYYQKAAELGQEDARISLAEMILAGKVSGEDENEEMAGNGNEDTIVRDFNSRSGTARLGKKISRIRKSKINIFE